MDRLRGEKGYHWMVFVVVVALAAGISAVIGYRFVVGSHRINRNATEIDRTQRALDRAETALTALCALRSDLDSRIVSEARSIRFGYRLLRKNPNGAFGFTPAQIKVSIQGQQRTLANSRRTRRALHSLDCPKKKKSPKKGKS